MTHHTIPWPDVALVENARWPVAKPRLSVLIPFKGDDPSRLLIALAREAVDAEIIVLDDGSRDEALAQRVGDTVTGLPLPARLVRLTANEGRAKGRNRLARHARGQCLTALVQHSGQFRDQARQRLRRGTNQRGRDPTLIEDHPPVRCHLGDPCERDALITGALLSFEHVTQPRPANLQFRRNG